MRIRLGSRATSAAAVLFLISFAWASEQSGPDPDAALAKLRRGNARSVSGQLMHPRQTATRRAELAAAQHPFAIVVSCSDSRVPPELLFDQGLGDLFVIRVAGNVVDATALGSIEYAVEHLGSRLVVVLGHERCGAVKAAVDGGEALPHIDALVKAIKPAVDEVAGIAGDKLDLAVRANIKHVVQQIRSSAPVMNKAVEEKTVMVVGMYYDLDTGRVETLQ